jgi:CHASE2 domain-containing sensor protein
MDAYFMISNHVGRSLPYLNTRHDIVIVDIKDIYDRDELADIVSMVVASEPSAVGLDVIFDQKKSQRADSVLAAIASRPNVVSPVILVSERTGSRSAFSGATLPFYMSDIRPNAGFVNVAASGATETCRFYTTALKLGNAEIPGFDMALIRAVSPSVYEEVMGRNEVSGYINYSLSSYSVFAADALPYNKDMLKDKIVLIGDRGDMSDMHVTPVGARVPGVDIHAMAIATILEGRDIDVMSESGAWILAFLVTMLIIPLMRLLKRNAWTAMFSPVFQTLLIIASVFICYLIFVSSGYYVRVVYVLLAIGFVDLGNNLYLKLKELCVKLLSR